MPTTGYNIDRILDVVTNFGAEEVLAVMNEAQKIVYSEDSEQTFKLDSATGLPPFLVTTKGQYTYDCPSDCRRTAVVYSESWPYPVTRTRPNALVKEYYFRARGYYNIGVSQRDALPHNNQLATVIFPNDPGTTTDKYYHLYYVLPTELTDINVQLTLPEHIHWRFRKLVLSMLAGENYGHNESSEMIIERQIKKIRAQLNGGANTMLGETQWRPEYLDYGDTPRGGRL